MRFFSKIWGKFTRKTKFSLWRTPEVAGRIFYSALVVSLLFLYTAGGATRYSFKNGAEVVLVVKSHL